MRQGERSAGMERCMPTTPKGDSRRTDESAFLAEGLLRRASDPATTSARFRGTRRRVGEPDESRGVGPGLLSYQPVGQLSSIGTTCLE